MESPPQQQEQERNFESVKTFQFHNSFDEDTNSGLYLSGFYIPEEVVTLILSYVDPKEILKVTLVCKRWCNIVKSDRFWNVAYSKKYNKEPKKLPWYVYYCLMSTNYFDTNLMKNENEQDVFRDHKIVYNCGNHFASKHPRCWFSLPIKIPEIRSKKTKLLTAWHVKDQHEQEISFKNSRLMQLIFYRFKPHIYVSEWVAGVFKCDGIYALCFKLCGTHKLHTNINDKVLYVARKGTHVGRWLSIQWFQIDFVVKNYPKGVKKILIEHERNDIHCGKTHCGCVVTGGVVKILFDTIESCNL